MSRTPETLKHEGRGNPVNERDKEILAALRRLREIGQSSPTVDAAAIVREGRNLAGRGAR